MVYVFLANGFEETEAIAPIDILRRCEKEVITVGIGDNIIRGAHGINIVTDTEDKFIELNEKLEMIVLPGGMPGTINLENSPVVQKAIDYCIENNKLIGAICATPSILGHKGLLKGKKATCFPGFEKELDGAEFVDEGVVMDGNIITARGAGAALEFSHELISALTNSDTADKLAGNIIWTK